jgi:dienelactone hydrolase
MAPTMAGMTMTTSRRAAAVAVAAGAALLLAGGAGSPSGAGTGAGAAGPVTVRPVALTRPAPHTAPPVGTYAHYAVSTREMSLSRGDRPLPTEIWYPAVGPAGTTVSPMARMAAGRFPVVIFSHGLHALPTDNTALITSYADAGFVVAAPIYPETSRGADPFNGKDVVNQPADASAVLTAVLALNTTTGDDFDGHLKTSEVAAVGHSAGGITTVGLFTSDRDARIKSGVVLAGDSVGVGDDYSDPAGPILFEHGDQDTVVPYPLGKHAYDADPWPKAFLTLTGQGHIDPYEIADSADFPAVSATTVDFLEWSLGVDPDGASRLATDAEGVGPLDDQLG